MLKTSEFSRVRASHSWKFWCFQHTRWNIFGIHLKKVNVDAGTYRHSTSITGSFLCKRLPVFPIIYIVKPWKRRVMNSLCWIMCDKIPISRLPWKLFKSVLQGHHWTAQRFSLDKAVLTSTQNLWSFFFWGQNKKNTVCPRKLYFFDIKWYFPRCSFHAFVNVMIVSQHTHTDYTHTELMRRCGFILLDCVLNILDISTT